MEEKISFIRHYQSSIEKSQNNPERVLHCLKKLQSLRVNVQDLQETGIGKTVNSLRKLDGEAGELATTLVTKWKDQISKTSDEEPATTSRIEPARKQSSKSSDNESKKKHSSSVDSSSEHGGKKSHKSHHSSGSSHGGKTSSLSHKRSRDDAAESKENETKSKKLKSDHEKESTSNGTGSKSRKKEHKRKHSSEEKKSQEFDGAQGIGFAEALASFDMPSSSSKHKKQDQMADKMTPVKSSSGKSKSTSSSSSHSKKDREKEKSDSRASTSEFKMPQQNPTHPPKLLTQKPKLDLLPDIVNELPNDVSIPEYRPIPMNSAMKEYILGSNSQSRHTKVLTEDDLLVQSFSSKANRTRVFSGNSKTRSQIPRLFDMCIRILQENIDYLECTGGVPFEILKPVLERAKPDQLSVIEYYNPYLLEDSDILWKPHCQRKWKNKQPLESEMETWREMFERCTREDDEKLSRLTQNIRQQQVITSNGIQKTKMAFVDSMVKPPRGMVRKQEQFGTNRKLVVSPAARIEALKNLQPNLAAPGDVRLRVAAGLRDDAQQIVGRGNMQRASLTKKAPMMAKILSKFKR